MTFLVDEEKDTYYKNSHYQMCGTQQAPSLVNFYFTLVWYGGGAMIWNFHDSDWII